MSTKVFSLARHNRKEELESYLDANEEIYPVDTPDDYGNSLLCVACQNGLKRIVKVLLRREADINFQNRAGNTPLHFCYAYEFLTLAEYLQTKGADPEILNNRGMSCYEGLGYDPNYCYGEGQNTDEPPPPSGELPPIPSAREYEDPDDGAPPIESPRQQAERERLEQEAAEWAKYEEEKKAWEEQEAERLRQEAEWAKYEEEKTAYEAEQKTYEEEQKAWEEQQAAERQVWEEQQAKED